MLLFRSEQDVAAWRQARHRPPGAEFTLEIGWRLAEAWAQNRLHPNWRESNRQEMETLLLSLGLTGDFWRLP